MGTSSWLATMLDQEMLEVVQRAHIHPRRTPLDQMGPRDGATVAKELGGRYFLHYIQRYQVGRYTTGRTGQTFVTPTPYSPEETIHFLTLPNPTQPREYVVLLDPKELRDVYGPRWTALGPGIEYILASGFDQKAIVASLGATPPWEILVR